MQFSISSIIAVGLSLSLAEAAPSRRAPLANKCAELGLPGNCVTFCGADTASCFAALFNSGASTPIQPAPLSDGTSSDPGVDTTQLSISSFSFDTSRVTCTDINFTYGDAFFPGSGPGPSAANAPAIVADGDGSAGSYFVGPPQPALSMTCSCIGSC